MTELSRFDPSFLSHEMERCSTWITDALEYGTGTHTYKDIVDGVLRGEFQFWPGPDACMVTQFAVLPQKKYLHIFLAGGNMATLDQMMEDAIRFARNLKQDGVTVAGRKGWVRHFRHRGFKEYCHPIMLEFNELEEV